jgi:hypothetical protein
MTLMSIVQACQFTESLIAGFSRAGIKLALNKYVGLEGGDKTKFVILSQRKVGEHGIG